MSTAAVATRQHTIRGLIDNDKVRAQIAQALPLYYTPEKFLVVVRTAINKNPKLEDCTPESFMIALLTAAQMGIAVDGRNGHLIPRRNKQKNIVECQFQADYKGLVNLVRKNDDVSDIYAVNVHEKDKFKLVLGLNRDLVHEPDVFADRGPIAGSYAVIKYKDGTSGFEFMSRAEIEAIRERSDGWRAFKSGVASSSTWKTDEGEMFKKTVTKRLLKTADLSPDTADRVAVEVESTATRLEETIPAARIEGGTAPALTEGEGEAQPAPAEEPPAPRRTRQAKAQPVDAPPANDTPKPQPAPATESSPPLPGAEATPPAASAHDRLRAEYAGYTDGELLAALVHYKIHDPATAKELRDVSPGQIQAALDEPEVLRDWMEAQK